MVSQKQFVLRAFGIFKPFHKHFAVALGLLALIESAVLLPPFFMGRVLNVLEVKGSLNLALALVGVFLAAGLLVDTLNWVFHRYLVKHIDHSVGMFLQGQTLAKLLELSIGQHKSQNSGVTQSVTNEGQMALFNLMNLVLLDIIPVVIRVIVTTGVLLAFNYIVGGTVLIGIACFIFVGIAVNRRFYGRIRAAQDHNRRVSKKYQEVLKNLVLVQVFSKEKPIQGESRARIEASTSEARNVWYSYQTWAAGRSAFDALIGSVSLCIGVLLVSGSGYRLGDLVVLMFWTNQAVSGLARTSALHRQWLNHSASVEKYFGILDIVPDVTEGPNPVRLESMQGAIEFEDVFFGYGENPGYITVGDEPDEEDDTDKTIVLSGVSFRIEPGEHVAFVGESGAGKTTIVRMLERASDPASGAIRIDGVDIANLDLTWYRSQLGVVDQDVKLFDGSIRYNIEFGLLGEKTSLSDTELCAVARMSCIDGFMHRLSKGFDTLIGENGIKLSGGQRQRVGIARALAKDPKILILDEATSSLDAVNEAKFMNEAVRKASLGRTTIIIAHRLSTVRHVDRIFVMERGKIVAVGKHDELLATSPQYARLVKSQL